MEGLRRSAKVIMSSEAKVLKRLREKKNYSMKKAGKLLGYSDSYISQIENGRANIPKGENLFKFLELYEISPKYFQELSRKYKEEETDLEMVQSILPKLKQDQVKVVKGLVEQMARREL